MRGTFICEYIGEVLDNLEADDRRKRYVALTYIDCMLKCGMQHAITVGSFGFSGMVRKVAAISMISIHI